MTAVELLAFYRRRASGRVVQVVGRTRDRLTLSDPCSGERFRVPREPFAADVGSGALERVEPEWVAQPAAEA